MANFQLMIFHAYDNNNMSEKKRVNKRGAEKIEAICYMTRNVCDDNHHHHLRICEEEEIIS